MPLDIIENLTGISFSDSNRDIILKTGGKPQRVFPYLVNDFSKFAYFDTDLYYYTGKHYEPFTDFDIDRYIRRFYLEFSLEDKYNLSRAREIKAMIKYDPAISKIKFDDYDNLVNLNNGVYNYDTKELLPHSHEYKFTYLIDVNYDKDKTECPVFTKFLQGCFATSGTWEDGFEYDKDVFENIIRLCGYLLYPKNRIEGLFLFIGNGANGKSVLMDTIRLFFPEKYITNLSLNAISNEEGFLREKLIRSMINFCTEQRGGSVNAEELKKVASGEGLSVQRKYSTAMDVISRTKIIVSLNNALYFNDNSYGIYRRLKMFYFKNKFVDVKDYEKEKNPESKGIFKKLDKAWLEGEIKKEKEAIFNLFLGGLERLRADEWNFVKSKNMEEILQEYKESSDTLGTWLSDNYEVGDEGFNFVSIEEVYKRFRTWYEDNFAKRCTYSSISVSKKIKDKFRFNDPIRAFEKDYNGRSVRRSGYPLKERTEELSANELLEKGFAETEDTLL